MIAGAEASENGAAGGREMSLPLLSGGSGGAGEKGAISTDAVRELLSDRRIFPGLSADLGEDAELVLDSLGLVWLLHQVEERYGLVVEPTDADIAELTSLRQLTKYLRAAQTAGAEGGSGDER